jgi:ribosomal protein S18 acetylase RimI-like enzyme
MLYLEDLIVTEQFRNQGIGKKLFDATIVEAGRSGCQGMIWQVLDWNEPAIEFYRKYDPVLDNQWVTCRLTREQILNHNPVS